MFATILPAELWHGLAACPLFWPGATLAAYTAGTAVQARLRGNALANPVLIAILLVGALLKASGTPYADYFAGAQPIHLLLGPATVALALPLVAALPLLRRSLSGVALALIAGATLSAASGLLLVKALGGSSSLALSMAPKAVTTPIAMALAQGLGGLPSVTASLAIAAGILVAVASKPILALCRVRDWRARGLAAGTAGSGVGAAHAIRLHETAGAFAGVAVGLNGLVTAVLIGPIARLCGF
jgi:putative effector of murein hydrolase